MSLIKAMIENIIESEVNTVVAKLNELMRYVRDDATMFPAQYRDVTAYSLNVFPFLPTRIKDLIVSEQSEYVQQLMQERGFNYTEIPKHSPRVYLPSGHYLTLPLTYKETAIAE